MKSLALALLLIAPATAFAATKPNPADFTVTIHVTSSASEFRYDGTLVEFLQILETTIDGQPFQLTGNSAGVLALGDYKARISTTVHGPHNPNSYDIYKGYDLLMPDGTARTYSVTRLGPAVPNP
jgi:hypothetical protein